MEWSPACGVLGVPTSLQCESQTGFISCSVTQLFAKVILDIPREVLLTEEPKHSDNNPQTPIDSNIEIQFSEDAIILKNKDGDVAIEAHPWGTLAPQSCQWHSTEDHSLRIILVKAPTSLGSWPYSFQSLTVLLLHQNQQPPPTLDSPGLSDGSTSTRIEYKLCDHDKTAFNNHADTLLASRIAESRGLKAAFAHAVYEQMSTLPCGPLGQSAFLFPQQGPHCLSFLKTCHHIPSVRKLVRLAHNITGILLETELDNEEEILTLSTATPKLLTFYSLHSLVGCLIAGLAAVEHYRFLHGIDAVKSISACIGFGAGEYAAAVFAGALRLQDALVAIKAHAQAFEDHFKDHFHQFKEDLHVEECRSQAIDAVRATLVGKIIRKQERNNQNNTTLTSTATTNTTVVEKQEELDPEEEEDEEDEEEKDAIVRSPRLIMYSGADAVVYENNRVAILNALPFGVCAGCALASHRHDVRIALMQQGVAEMTVLVPEEGDEIENEDQEDGLGEEEVGGGVDDVAAGCSREGN